MPCEGKLYYRGIDIEDIVKGFIEEDRFGFEETAYLLLFGELPKKGPVKNSFERNAWRIQTASYKLL